MKKSLLFSTLLALLFVGLSGCQKQAKPNEYMPKAANPERYNACLNKLTQVVIHDIFSPPVLNHLVAN